MKFTSAIIAFSAVVALAQAGTPIDPLVQEAKGAALPLVQDAPVGSLLKRGLVPGPPSANDVEGTLNNNPLIPGAKRADPFALFKNLAADPTGLASNVVPLGKRDAKAKVNADVKVKVEAEVKALLKAVVDIKAKL
ncbi:hypothetical protein BGX33_010984, partial [Mortierella sp. NVP41]